MVTMTVLTILMKITVFKSAMNKGWFQSFLPNKFFLLVFFSEKDRNQKNKNFNVRTESVFQNHFSVMDNTTALEVLTSLTVQVRFSM